MTRLLCSRWSVLFAASLLATSLWAVRGLAEPPQPERPSDPPSIENAMEDPPETPPASESSPADLLVIPPELQQPLPPLPPPDADARRRFDEAVQRRIQEALENGDTAATGDPILDGTLNAIRRQGSVLKDWPADQALFSTPAGPPHNPPAGSQPDEAHYHTAEALLRSARLLSQLPGQDATRQQLIHELRREAARCLAVGAAPAM
ncbi:hypothetical protein [Roseimaritima ulvae]|uniref:Uncharacterized protein n=1 Tax=Roseimaritima ulvae TaxID=980254 RepID=A0A5B9QME2_9BACT|nr:hypothetical protein [Roseimaritima ulvae]QEG39022.1 hypothetical protein UC8_09830 [Roseimaritima ulvae]